MERICRICLRAEDNLEFMEIFSKSSEIALKINLVSGMKIVELVNCVPALMCSECLRELFQAFQFRKKCQNAEEFFKTNIIGNEENFWRAELENATQEEEIGFEETKMEEAADIHKKALMFSCHIDPKPKDESPPKEPKLKSSQCRFCGLVLSRRNRRIEHERLHIKSVKPTFECHLCGKLLNQKFGIIPHFRKHHNYKSGPKEKWKCAICDDKILQPGHMAFHYEKEHSNLVSDSAEIHVDKVEISAASNRYRQIPRSQSNRRQERKPTVKKSEAVFWPCSTCGNSFSNYQRYQKHLREQHDINNLQEDSSLVKNFGKVDKSQLLNQPAKVPKFPCTTCGKLFASVMTCRAHEKTHLDVSYVCDICGSAFQVKSYLVAHAKKVHMKLRIFKCSIENCSASFVHRELLNYHVKKHLNIRNFVCRYCGKTFVTRSCCTIHERIHTEERPYSCRICERTFVHHSDHRRHELKHEKAA